MKNNKVLIIIAVIVVNLLAVFMIGQSFLGRASEYDKAVAAARGFAEDKLFSKAVTMYEQALEQDENIELRLEMLDTIRAGIDFGEFTNVGSIYDATEDLVEIYSDNPIAYETLCRLYVDNGMYEDCVEMLLKAKGLKIKSDKLDEITEEIRYLYEVDYTTYTNVSQLYGNAYLVTLEDGKYAYLNSQCGDAFGLSFIKASSFSQGYAFVKTTDKEGNLIGTIINGSGQRQVYLNDVEDSSGVGHAYDTEGEVLLLLSGKVGETYKYFNIDGTEAFGGYLFAGRFRNNVAAVKIGENQWQLINGQNKVITDTVFEDVILNEFDECASKGIIFAKSNGKYHMYNSNGEQIGNFECDSAKCFVDGYAAFKNNDLWGYVDYNGNVIMEPQYEDANSFSCGIAGVKLGEYWKYINVLGEVVIEANIEEAGFFASNGLLFVKSNGRYACLQMYYRENS